jgi:hypothetical protein
MLEDAAQDLFALGRVRPAAELAEGIASVGGASVRSVFEQMLADGASVALAGRLPRTPPTQLARAPFKAKRRVGD